MERDILLFACGHVSGRRLGLYELQPLVFGKHILCHILVVYSSWRSLFWRPPSAPTPLRFHEVPPMRTRPVPNTPISWILYTAMYDTSFSGNPVDEHCQ